MKKDLDYIAKLEKAISEKYGEITTINPKALWNEQKEKEYLASERPKSIIKKVDRVEKDGVLISKKLLINKNTNKTCCVCERYSFEGHDDLYLTKFETCKECYIFYIEDREDRWNKGWRPQEQNK